MMSIGAIIADIILVSILVISTYLAFRKGFTFLVFNFISLIITIIAVIALCKPLTTFVYENTKLDDFLTKHIKNSIGNFVEKQVEKEEQEEAEEAEETNISKPIANKINEYIDEAEEKTVKNVSTYVANKLAYIVISALVIIFLFIALRLLTFILRKVLAFIADLPFIKSIDKTGGVIYGLIRACIIIYLVLAVFSLLSPLLANTGIIAAINSSRVCSRFYHNNIFLNIIMK